MNLESGKATAAGNVERSVPIKPLGPAASIDVYASAGFEVDTSTGEPDGVVEIGISVGAGMGKMRQNFFKVGVGVTTSGEKFFTVQALPYYGSLRCVENPNEPAGVTGSSDEPGQCREGGWEKNDNKENEALERMDKMKDTAYA